MIIVVWLEMIVWLYVNEFVKWLDMTASCSVYSYVFSHIRSRARTPAQASKLIKLDNAANFFLK